MAGCGVCGRWVVAGCGRHVAGVVYVKGGHAYGMEGGMWQGWGIWQGMDLSPSQGYFYEIMLVTNVFVLASSRNNWNNIKKSSSEIILITVI